MALPLDPFWAQVAGFVGALFAGFLIVWRAKKDKEALPPSASMPDGVQMFMHGPVIAALDTLKAAHDALKALLAGQRETIEILRRIEESGHRIRDGLRDNVEQTGAVRDTLRDNTDVTTKLLRSILGALLKVLMALRGPRPERE